MDKNIRICIIGGGPAGLSAGMYLEQKGYENYTILEKNDRVGGKCWSPYYNGRRYEMGAIMGVPSYYAVHDVEETLRGIFRCKCQKRAGQRRQSQPQGPGASFQEIL